MITRGESPAVRRQVMDSAVHRPRTLRQGVVCLAVAIALVLGATGLSSGWAEGHGQRIGDGVASPAIPPAAIAEEVAALPDRQAGNTVHRMTEEPRLGQQLIGRPHQIADAADNMRLLVQLMSMIASCDYRCGISPK